VLHLLDEELAFQYAEDELSVTERVWAAFFLCPSFVQARKLRAGMGLLLARQADVTFARELKHHALFDQSCKNVLTQDGTGAIVALAALWSELRTANLVCPPVKAHGVAHVSFDV